MLIVRRWMALLTPVVAASVLSGCQIFSLLPSTTWKLNRGPAMDEGHGYFSIPDPQPADDR
ncbi:MAG: hypothetical protein AB7Q45_21460 [Planctomycetaceae bacterium]